MTIYPIGAQMSTRPNTFNKSFNLKTQPYLPKNETLRFSSSYEPHFAPLTYTALEPIQDPVVGTIHRYQFSNGMNFYGIQNQKVPLVSVGELIHTGSINEKEHENGVSHFLEHLIFKGSRFLPKGQFKQLAERLGGQINAGTGRDYTFYYSYDIPKEHLDETLKYRAEFIQNATIPNDELEKERSTVISEIREANQSPFTELFERALQTVWGNSPLRRPIIGPEEVINTIPRQVIIDYYNHFYHPNNRSILMVGNFDLEPALKTIANEYNKPFSPVNRTRNRKKLTPLKNINPVIDFPLDSVERSFIYDGPHRNSKDWRLKDSISLQLLSDILGGGKNSRLHKSIVEEKKLATETASGVIENKTRSLFFVDVSTPPETIDAAHQAVEAELQQVIDHGVSDQELQNAQKKFKRNFAYATQKQSSVLEQLANAVGQNTLPTSFHHAIEVAASVTPQDIQTAAKQYLTPSKQHVISIQAPTNSSNSVNAISFSGHLKPGIENEHIFENGAKLLTHHDPQSLLSTISIKIKGGDALAEKPGSGDLLALMLDRGNTELPFKAFQDLLSHHGLSLTTESQDNSFSIHITGLNDDLEAMKKVIKSMLSGPPTLTEDNFSETKRQTKGQLLRQLQNNPRLFAFEGLLKMLYPRDHRYTWGNKTILNHLDDSSTKDIKTLYTKLFNPRGMAISIAGDAQMTPALQDEVNEWLQPLKDNSSEDFTRFDSDTLIPEPLEEDTLRTLTINRNENQMELSEIFLGWRTFDKRDPDYPTLLVLDSLMKNGLSSRLFKTFREGESGGLCYSVNSQYRTSRHGGYWMWTISTPHDNVTQVQQLFKKEIETLKMTAPNREEIQRAKALLKSNFLSAQQTIPNQSNLLAGHKLWDTPNLDDLMTRINTVTGPDIQRLSQRILNKPMAMTIAAPQTAFEKNNLPVNKTIPYTLKA